MALTAGSTITASDIIALKNRVRNEMNRRCYYGSLTTYASSSYEFATTPSSGGLIRQEQGEKIVVPLNAITNQGMSVSSGSIIRAFQVLSSNLSAYESQGITGGSSCSSNCSGLCTAACYGTCKGSCTSCSSCSGSCTSCSGCSGSCSGCSGGCSGCSGCGYGCSGCYGCSGVCQNSCSGCSGKCTGGSSY